MHEPIMRLVRDVEAEFAKDVDHEAVSAATHRSLMAFIGRVGVVDGKFKPIEQVLPLLREARAALMQIKCGAAALHVRSELLRELETTTSALMPVQLPPARL